MSCIQSAIVHVMTGTLWIIMELVRRDRDMEQLKNVKWWNAACTRCLKTMCQTAIAMIGTSQLMEQVDIKFVVSSTALAGILSLLTSLSCLPEVETTKEN